MADMSVRDWITTQDAQERNEIARDIAGSLDLGVLQVPALLQELEPYLNADADLLDAANGLEALAEILSYIQTDFGRLDLHALAEYLCVRLENKEQIPSFRAGVESVARSLLALANMTARFPRGDASVTAKAVFSLTTTTLRDQKPATRFTLFVLLQWLVQTYSATLTRDMGPQLFVDGLVSMSAVEKDPKCLRILFQTYEQISQTWSLNSDDFNKIWESFSKYWPISFKDVPSDPSIPTTTELNLLIQKCFTSHDNYAVHAFDHLLKVLDASQDTITTYTKNTVLEAFATCFSAYSTATAAVHCSQIWDALKFEIWDGTNDEFIERTEKVFFAIVSKLDNGHLDWHALTTPLAKFVIDASTECSQRLHDSKQQHVLGSGRILRAIGSASHLAFDLIIRNLLPRMFLMWDDAKFREKKTLLLDVFNHILQARLDLREGVPTAVTNALQSPSVVQRLQTSEALVTRSLANFQQSLVDDVYITAMTEKISGHPDVDTPFRVNTIKGLVLGARIPSFLSDYHKGTVVSEFNDLVLDRAQKQVVHDEVVSALLQIHIEDPNRYLDITVPKFMAALPNRTSTNLKTLVEEIAEVVFILEAFSKISCAASCRVDTVPVPTEATTDFKFRVFDGFQNALIDKMFGFLGLQGQVRYANAILAAMFRGLQVFDEVQAQEATGTLTPAHLQAVNPYAWIILKLYHKLVKQKQHVGGSLAKLSYMGFGILLDEDEKVNDMFVSLLGRITTLALRSSQTSPVNKFFFKANKHDQTSQVWNLFCEESPEPLIDSTQPNLVEGPAEKCLANVLSLSLVAGIRREDKDQLKIHVSNVALSMIKNAISTNNNCSAYAQVSMLHFLQLLINKFGAIKEKLENEDRSLPQVIIELAASCVSKTNVLEIERIYQALAYFAAASLAAGDRSDKQLVDQMVIGLLDSRVGRKVAQSFRLLLAPSPIMSTENFCVIRKLYKQRLYGMTVDHLISQWRQSQNKEQKGNYLIALAGIFTFMDPKLLEDNASDIFPLILEGTNVQNEDYTMFTYINLIKGLIATCPNVVSDYVDSVINRMTDRTHNTYDSPSDASVKCRAAALEVLASLVDSVESRKLLPRKAKVLVELDIALDDCSRTVRSAAERTKMHWFNLAEVGN